MTSFVSYSQRPDCVRRPKFLFVCSHRMERNDRELGGNMLNVSNYFLH